jgi:hypothetical protein
VLPWRVNPKVYICPSYFKVFLMRNKLAAGLLSLLFPGMLHAQTNVSAGQLLGQQNTITTTVPILLIAPDARGGALGDAGAATTPDPISGHWNPSKFAFIEKKGGVSISYTPWLRQLVDGVSISYLAAFGRINKFSTVAGSLRYFALGNINFTDNYGQSLGSFNPHELALDGSYATRLSENFSVGVSMRFIYSNLAGKITVNNVEARPGVAGAGDISCYYQNKKRLKSKKMMNYAIGFAITNIGNKITYTSDAQRDFIPINMRLGGYTQFELDDYNSIGLALDFNKLLVPTPPIYERDSFGKIVLNPDGSRKTAYGKDNNVPTLQGIFQSFGDAPNGFKEEIHEINVSFGAEYWYQKQFAIRTGFFYEHPTKGARKYLTFGIGVRYNVFGLDVSYLAPLMQRHPLQNTLRFTLLFDFAAFKDGGDQTK